MVVVVASVLSVEEGVDGFGGGEATEERDGDCVRRGDRDRWLRAAEVGLDGM